MTLFPTPTRGFFSRMDAAIERWNRADDAAVYFINNGSWPENIMPDTIEDAKTCLSKETREEAERHEDSDN